MELLIAGLLIFFAVHLVPNIGETRARLLERFGEKGYMPVYAVLSLVGIVLIVMGKSRAEFVGLWIPPAWGKSVALVFMALSVFFFVSIFISNNLTRKVHHPMLAFVAVWGVAHLLSNGDLSALLLFGGLTVFSVFKMVSLTRRKPPELKRPVSMVRDVIAVALAAVVYGGVIYFHDAIAGVSLV
jgi:uncharacterized membrane protein